MVVLVVLVVVVDECVDEVSLGDVEDDDLLRRKRRRSLLPVKEEDSSDEMELAVVEAPDLCCLRMDLGLLVVMSSVLEHEELRREEEEEEEEVRRMSFDLEFVLEAVEKVRLPAWYREVTPSAA